MSRRRCKDVNILDQTFVEDAIANFMSRRTPKERRRTDIVRLYEKYGDNSTIARMLIEGLRTARKTGTLNLKPIVYRRRYDESSRKWRDIAVEDVVRQLYDEIAVQGLKEATVCIGEYQCTCLRNQKKLLYTKDHKPILNEDGTQKFKMIGRGQIWARDAAYGWMSDPAIRQIAQGDIYHNYASINHEKLFAFLEKHIKNDWLIFLIHCQIDEYGEKGIPIGSVLSITLDALYLSQIYHHMMEQCYRIRKHRDGTTERIALVKHCEIWMDDIFIFCTSKKNAEMALKELKRYAKTLDLEIKPSAKIIDKVDPPKHPNIHQARQSYVDTVGYRVYPDHITIRRKNYITAKRNIKRGRKHMTLRRAQSIMSQRGIIINSDSYRFRKKYNTRDVWRTARKEIRNNAKSNIRQQTGNNEVHDGGRENNCPDLHERGRSAAGAGRRNEGQ